MDPLHQPNVLLHDARQMTGLPLDHTSFELGNDAYVGQGEQSKQVSRLADTPNPPEGLLGPEEKKSKDKFSLQPGFMVGTCWHILAALIWSTICCSHAVDPPCFQQTTREGVCCYIGILSLLQHQEISSLPRAPNQSHFLPLQSACGMHTSHFSLNLSQIYASDQPSASSLHPCAGAGTSLRGAWQSFAGGMPLGMQMKRVPCLTSG